MKQVRKLRSKHYSSIIEVNVPSRFYWDETGFDGFEFGEFKQDLTKHQKHLLNELLNDLAYQTASAKFIEYMKEYHPKELELFINEFESVKAGIPQVFIAAFKEENNETNAD